MSKSKALCIVTISVAPHTPALRRELEFADSGEDTVDIVAELVGQTFLDLKREQRRIAKASNAPS